MKNFLLCCFSLIFFMMPIFLFSQHEKGSELSKNLYSKYKLGIMAFPFYDYYPEKSNYHVEDRHERNNFSIFFERAINSKASLLWRINIAKQKLPKSIQNLDVNFLKYNTYSLDYKDYIAKSLILQSKPTSDDFSSEELFLGKGFSVDLAYQKYFRKRVKGNPEASFYIGLRTGKGQYIDYHKDFTGTITSVCRPNGGLFDFSGVIGYDINGQIHYSLEEGEYYYTNLIYGLQINREILNSPIHLGFLLSGQSHLKTSDDLHAKFKKIALSLNFTIAYVF